MYGADRRAVGYIVRNGGPRGPHVDVLVHRDAVYIVAGDGGVDGCDEAAWDQVMRPGLGVGVFGGLVRVRFFVCIEGCTETGVYMYRIFYYLLDNMVTTLEGTFSNLSDG